MRTQQRGSGLALVILLVVVLGIIGEAGWYVWRTRMAVTTTHTQSAGATTTYQNSGWNTTVTSGMGAFRVTFPDGWNVLRDTASDAFMIGSEVQPTVEAGIPAKVTSSQFGSDGPLVLYMGIVDGEMAVPHGTATDFLLENGKTNPIQGKKYAYDYPADETGDIGGGRLRGDHDYTYLFALPNGKHLQVFYAVYGSDPRNNVATVEALIRTIQLLNT